MLLISSNFVVINDRLWYFWIINGLLRDCSQNKVYLRSFGHVGVQLSGRAFDCRSRIRWLNSARSLFQYSGLLVERL